MRQNPENGFKALETFREFDQSSKITIITKEKGPAYSRVLLPYCLRKKVNSNQLYIRDWAYYQKMKASVIEDTVTLVDFEKKEVILKNGNPLPYDRLLIATGSKPVNPPIHGLKGPGVYNLWTLEDMRNIEAYFQEGKRVLVIGAAFISLQAAWAAAQRKLKVSNQKTLEFDLIIVGAGIKPNIDFLKTAELITGEGIQMNHKMETGIPDVYAAGDVAAGPFCFGKCHRTSTTPELYKERSLV